MLRKYNTEKHYYSPEAKLTATNWLHMDIAFNNEALALLRLKLFGKLMVTIPPESSLVSFTTLQVSLRQIEHYMLSIIALIYKHLIVVIPKKALWLQSFLLTSLPVFIEDNPYPLIDNPSLSVHRTEQWQNEKYNTHKCPELCNLCSVTEVSNWVIKSLELTGLSSTNSLRVPELYWVKGMSTPL